MRILVTRPGQDGVETAALLAASGHQALLAPLLQTRWLEGPPPDFTGVAAILATSANGVRALVRRTDRRDIPLFAVGPQTAETARAAGFLRVENADGDAKTLAASAPRWIAPCQLLHVCGEDSAGNLAEDLAAHGYDVRRAILYAVDALPLAGEAAKALRAGALDAALFFSPRSARIFLEQASALPLKNLTAFCISPATASVLPPDLFAAIRVAAAPNQQALLALLGS